MQTIIASIRTTEIGGQQAVRSITGPPVHPDEKRQLQALHQFYAAHRDVRNAQPQLEAGWNARAGAEAAARNHRIHVTKAFDGTTRLEMRGSEFEPRGMGAPRSDRATLASLAQQQQPFYEAVVATPSGPVLAAVPLPVPTSPQYWSPSNVVSLDSQQHRLAFDYLKRHTRSPLSPFLAASQGFAVPPELFLSKAQFKIYRQKMREMHGEDVFERQAQELGQTPDSIRARINKATLMGSYWTSPEAQQQRAAREQQQRDQTAAAAHSKREWNDRFFVDQQKPSCPVTQHRSDRSLKKPVAALQALSRGAYTQIYFNQKSGTFFAPVAVQPSPADRSQLRTQQQRYRPQQQQHQREDQYEPQYHQCSS